MIYTIVMLLVVTAIVMLLIQLQQDRKATLKRQKQFISLIRRLQNENRALCAGAIGIGERLRCIEQEVQSQSQKQRHLQLHQVHLGNYSHAAALLKMGASPEQVKSTCALSQGEMEFMLSLQKAPPSVAS